MEEYFYKLHIINFSWIIYQSKNLIDIINYRLIQIYYNIQYETTCSTIRTIKSRSTDHFDLKAIRTLYF